MFGTNLLDEYALAHTRFRFTPKSAPRTSRQRRRSQLPLPTQKLVLLARIERYR